MSWLVGWRSKDNLMRKLATDLFSISISSLKLLRASERGRVTRERHQPGGMLRCVRIPIMFELLNLPEVKIDLIYFIIIIIITILVFRCVHQVFIFLPFIFNLLTSLNLNYIMWALYNFNFMGSSITRDKPLSLSVRKFLEWANWGGKTHPKSTVLGAARLRDGLNRREWAE